MRLLKLLFYGSLIVLVLVILMLIVGLDYKRLHSLDAQKLPDIELNTNPNLVKINTGDMTFRARVAGFDNNEAKPVVILLHGFPTTSVIWSDLIPLIAKAGYRVVAFDQRGYSPEARPKESESYRINEIVNDIFAIADAIGVNKFHLVGHDMGAIIGWSAVLQNPARIKSWTSISSAHPMAFAEAIYNDSVQQQKSKYLFMHTLPYVPEIYYSFNNFNNLKKIYHGLPEEQMTESISALREPGALTAVLNWYRSKPLKNENTENCIDCNISIPTLLIWGKNDKYISKSAIEYTAAYMKGPYKIVELEADNWVLSNSLDNVTIEILEHINKND